MEKTFRQALLEHLDRTGAKPSQVADATGIKRDTVYSVTRGTTRNMNVLDAIRIAAFFGETVEQFMGVAPEQIDEALVRQIANLSPEERRILSASIAALTASRHPTARSPDRDEEPAAPALPPSKDSASPHRHPPAKTTHKQEQ